MKKRFLLVLILLMTGLMSAKACEFKFLAKGNPKECHVGDTITVTVELTLIHSNCSKASDGIKFKVEGGKVIDATSWMQAAPNKFYRTVKMVVMKDDKDKLKLTAFRGCENGGGNESFVLPKA